jgi:hypothetical protein
LHGATDNPTVVANPLSALTPGILRGMFGLFGEAPTASPPPPGNAAPLDGQGSGGNVRQP